MQKTNSPNVKYCPNCGTQIGMNFAVCPNCGRSQPPVYNMNTNSPASSERWLVSLLLCLCLGYLGVHRFYTGHTLIGVVQLLTFGGCTIWWIIDIILIITNSYRDSDGYLLK